MPGRNHVVQRAFDVLPLFEALGDTIHTGPTVRDLRVLVRETV